MTIKSKDDQLMYTTVMDFITTLKLVAQDIIELSEKMGDEVHTWKQQATKSNEDYSDRAGFISFGDIELCADIFLGEDKQTGLFRARLAHSPDADKGIFTLITLHFTADKDKATKVIANRETISQQSIAALLSEASTTPQLIHVSFKSTSDGDGQRFEYDADRMKTLSEDDKTTFLSTLHEAFDYIANK